MKTSYSLNKDCNEKLLGEEGFWQKKGIFIKKYPIKHPGIFVQIIIDLENKYYRSTVVTRNGLYTTYYTPYGNKSDYIRHINRCANRVLKSLCDKGVLYRNKKGAKNAYKKSVSRKK